MFRRQRLLSGFLLGLGLLALAAGLLYRYALPPFVEAKVRAALVGAGLPDAEFRLADLSLAGATIRDIRLDREGRLTAEEVRVTLDLPRIDTVTVSGLRFLVRYDDGRLDLGPVDTILASGEPGEPGPAPLRRLVLAGARITVDAFGESRDFAVDGEVGFRPDGRIEPRLGARGEGFDLRLAGEIRPADGTGLLRAEIDAALPRLAFGPLTAREIAVSGTLSVTDLARVAEAHLDLRARSLSLDDFGATAVAVRIRGAVAEIDAEAEGLAVAVRDLALPADPRAWYDGERRLAGTFRADGRPAEARLPPDLAVGWCAAAGGFDIDLREGRARVGAGEVRFEGVEAGPFRESRGTLRFSAGYGPEGVTARALPGSTAAGRFAEEEIEADVRVEEEARFTLAAGGRWTLEAPAIRAAGRTGGPGGFEAEAELGASASAVETGLAIRLRAGSSTTVRRPGEEPFARAVLEEEAAFDRPSGGAWSAGAPLLGVSAEVAGLAVVPGAVEFDRLVAEMDLRVTASSAGIEARASSGGRLRSAPLRLLGPEGFRVDLDYLALREMTAGFVAGEGLRVTAAVEGTGPFMIVGKDVSGVLEGFTVAGEVAMTEGARPVVDLRTEADFGQLHLHGPDVLLTGVRVELPARFGPTGASAGPGTVRAGEVSVAGRRFPGFTADLAPEGDGLAFRSRWALTPGVALDVRGLAHLFGEEVFAEASLDLPPSTVAADDLLGRLLLRDTGAGITGRCSLSGSARVGVSGASAVLDLAALDARVSLGEDAVVAEGVRAQGRLLVSDGFRIEGESGFEWRGISMGEFPVGKGSGRVEAGDFGTIAIRGLRFSMGAEGRFLVDDFAFEPAAPDIRTTIRVVNWDLAD
ncbi:MAG: hypothetical protein MUE73_14585, partial [Planctomycetes bacterium]|nr:hypothetical protein [Planctomycetota bacterium]